MTSQRAIFVPGHERPETISGVRFIPQTTLAVSACGAPSRQGMPAPPSTVEIWLGDFYGDPTGEMLTSRSASDRTEFVFSENARPVVPPERSLVVVIRDPTASWNVEVDSVLKDDSGNVLARRVTIDNFGTARKSLNGQKP
jgi:hypothetical protein